MRFICTSKFWTAIHLLDRWSHKNFLIVQKIAGNPGKKFLENYICETLVSYNYRKWKTQMFFNGIKPLIIMLKH